MAHDPMTVALRWAERGFRTFPIAIGWDHTKQGTSKRPLTPHGHHDASSDPLVVKDQFVQYGERLRDGEQLAAGMCPGDYLVADCDRHGHGDGPAYADSIGLNHTWTVDTASGGQHRIYRKPPGATYSNTVPDDWRGLIDIRADAGWIVCPGCSTSWGSWTPRTPWDPTQVADLPADIAALLQPATTSHGSWSRYTPERDNPRLDPANIETHTILVTHYGIDPTRTTIRDAADPNTGELHPVLDVIRPGKSDGRSGSIGYISPGGLWVFTDAWPQLTANRGYSANELLMKARGPWQPASPTGDTDTQDNPYGYIDWNTLWADDTIEREDLIPGIWTVGAAGSIYSPAGAGKSLLGLEWAACLALGLPILGEPVTPRTVLYLDLENDEHLIRERLEALGLAEQPIPNLHYSLLGDWQPLDTAPGGAMLLSEATRLNADLVIIDTTSRVIHGEENNADTFLALFRHTIRPLKAAHISTMRLDHAGKDPQKGERGSSAKRSDVDLTYRLTLTDGHVTLQREKNRPHLTSPDTLLLQRTEDPLRHTPLHIDHAQQRRVADLVTTLDSLGIPLAATRRQARATLKAHGIKVRDVTLNQALTRRRLLVPDQSGTSGNHGNQSGVVVPVETPPPLKGRGVTGTTPEEPEQPREPTTCDTCGQRLLLVIPGRTRCAACDKQEATP